MTAVALLGTGRMGSAMARTLARAGIQPVLYNRTAERAETLARELGTRTAGTAAEAAAAADVTLSMVADEDAVEELYRGDDGLIAGLREGSVAVDLSTVPPSSIRALEQAVRARGAGILDAPVSGSVMTADSGQLTLMVGGEARDLERARPALEPLAKAIFHVGPLGSGAAMKLAVNAVIFGLNNALSEALVLAERAGVDRAVAYEVLAASAVGAPFVQYKRAAFLEPETTPTAFALELAEKDLRLITTLARDLGVPMAQAQTNIELIRAAGRDRAGDDFASVAVHLRERSAQRPTAATSREGTQPVRTGNQA
jgi:3-hydroxyisobutyrate dehydrogenase-like beta-hydroxyacid dehydrogenase